MAVKNAQIALQIM